MVVVCVKGFGAFCSNDAASVMVVLNIGAVTFTALHGLQAFCFCCMLSTNVFNSSICVCWFCSRASCFCTCICKATLLFLSESFCFDSSCTDFTSEGTKSAYTKL